jgi:hypothetical protein
MPARVTHRVTLTRPEIKAILVGLCEYLYLVEEGIMEDILDETGYAADGFELTALEAAELSSRFEDLLREPRAARG